MYNSKIIQNIAWDIFISFCSGKLIYRRMVVWQYKIELISFFWHLSTHKCWSNDTYFVGVRCHGRALVVSFYIYIYTQPKTLTNESFVEQPVQCFTRPFRCRYLFSVVVLWTGLGTQLSFFPTDVFSHCDRAENFGAPKRPVSSHHYSLSSSSRYRRIREFF